MSEGTATAEQHAPQLEGGTYEIIRSRLQTAGEELRERLELLNEARKDVFGSIDSALISTERITTAHNCVPRDLIAVGGRFVFGYNVQFGLKTEIELQDVFAVYEFRDDTFHEQPLDLIQDERFAKDFRDVYRYYKEAVFAKFFTAGPYLYMVFRVGKTASDIKTFKWAVQVDRLTYVDNRSDHEVRFPPQHEFSWTRTHRDLHQAGPHPHVSIDDRVFVETVGGDLTIKVEDNTESGEGIYSEPVDDPDQTLDDAEIHYAIIGNLILLKIRPYREETFRYIVFNDKQQTAQRLDAIREACVLLPDDHGLIFSNGYYLQTGDAKTFDSGLQHMLFERRIPAPNGEDYLYVFYNREAGDYVLLRYNLISQEVDTPITCNGFSLFADGRMLCFKHHADPQKHHPLQIWQTPYVGENYIPDTNTDSYLYRIGNRDVVRGMAECHEVLNLLDKDDTYANLYVDLVRTTTDVLDTYFWINNEECFRPDEPLSNIRSAATAAIDEYEKVVRVRQNTEQETKRVREKTREITAAIDRKRFDQVHDYVRSLADLRTIRGEIIALRDLRYIDDELVDQLEQEASEKSEQVAQRCVQFLLRPDALKPYEDKVAAEHARVSELTKVSAAKKVEEEISASAAELEMLIEIVSNLRIEDATQRTTIIDNISAIFAKVNTARAALKNAMQELARVEGVAEFGSQIKLLSQGVVNYLDICDTPQKCDEYLTKVMIQLEELEGRFAEFDEFVIQLSEKRDEIYNAFETRKLALVEARNKRADALMNAAERILGGIRSRVERLESINEIHGYFASDLMIEKVRDICRQLGELDDSVKVDDIQSRLKTVREDAVRQLKDRQELFVGGENVIRFGKHHFNVNVQTLDLTTVLRDERLHLHLTGTNFFEPIENAELLATRDVWDQEVISENRGVYRGEYLVHAIVQSLGREGVPTADELLKLDQEQLLTFVQQFMGPRYSEGYTKGVHDQDGARLLRAVLEIHRSIGLLRYHAESRALANICWKHYGDEASKQRLVTKLKGVRAIAHAFPHAAARQVYVGELREFLADCLAQTDLFDAQRLDEAAGYLFDVLVQRDHLPISRTAARIRDEFLQHLSNRRLADEFRGSLDAMADSVEGKLDLARDWVRAFVGAEASEESGRSQKEAAIDQQGEESSGESQQSSAESEDTRDDSTPGAQDADWQAEYVDEVAGLLLEEEIDHGHVIDAEIVRKLEGMVGSHPVIRNGEYVLHYNRFFDRLTAFRQSTVPRFQRYIELKKEIVEAAREDLRLDEFRPRVLTSFVRNRLLDTVYLPLIGDNLAKQIGAAGESKRTDLMGLLLLISPPGYGKTTLMEYIANRLGIIFMKINGPAIGHQVTSLDPAEAPNAGAREEVEKLNLALEMGDNVMLYLDDIQHCNPELLQKFISLCDATRRIEGVYKGRTRTYDLRGRKVAVVMAGNPYTESGERFQIPDMLANRADIYNLGEIIGDNADAFEMSYVENALTSNPVLAKLAARSQKDVGAVIRMAGRGSREGIELEGNYSSEELGEFVGVMEKLLRVRDVILTVNREYIRSAAQSDDYRTEPPFKLQGSYRNMNRIAEKVMPIMNDDELTGLIVSNYENDAQTLTSGTEANLLKFRELTGWMDEAQAQRWAEIKRTFQKNVKMRGIRDDDQFGQAIMQLSAFSDGLDSIRDTLGTGLERFAEQSTAAGQLATAEEERVAAVIAELRGLRESLEQMGEAVAARQQQAASSVDSSPEATTPARTVRVTDPDDEAGADQAGDPNTITVINRIPPTLLRVLQQQFRLMHGWMQPILTAATANSGEIAELRELLKQCMADYERLVGRVRAARSSDDDAE